jgi:hypothetical protein
MRRYSYYAAAYHKRAYVSRGIPVIYHPNPYTNCKIPFSDLRCYAPNSNVTVSKDGIIIRIENDSGEVLQLCKS